MSLIRTSLPALAMLALAIFPATAATFSMKRGINLDIWTTWPGEDRWGDPEIILPYPEWRKTVGAAELAALKDAGFDFVRIPVDPSPFLSDKTPALREQLFASVLESVRLVNAAGLKAVVDMHLIPAGERSLGMERVMNEPELFDTYVELVRKMARTLSREDLALVAFEPMNEPVADCEGDAADLWAERQKRLFAAARASATQLTLILTGGCMGSAEGLAALDPKDIPDDNIVWTFHSYGPFLLTHQGATWAGDFIRYVTGLPYPPHAASREELDVALEKVREKIEAEAPWSRRSGMLAYLDEQVASMDTAEELSAIMDEPFDMVAEWAEKHGVRPENIFLGEFGMIRQEWENPFVMPAASRAAYARDMIARAERHGFAWSLWSYGGAFGIAEEFEGRKAEPDVLEMVRSLP